MTTPTAPAPRVSIVIPFTNQAASLLRCLKAIARYTTSDLFEIVAVDDGSNDEAAALLAGLEGGIKILSNKTRHGLLAARNEGAAVASGTFIAFLGADTAPMENWLGALLARAEPDAQVGAACVRLVSPDGTLLEAGGAIAADGSASSFGAGDQAFKPEYDQAREVDYGSASALFVRREAFFRAGGFKTEYGSGAHADADLCFAIRRAGFKVIYCPGSFVVRFSGHGDAEPRRESQKIFVERWTEELRSRAASVDRSASVNGSGAPPSASSRAATAAIIIEPTTTIFDGDEGGERLARILVPLRELGCKVKIITRDRLENDVTNTAFDYGGPRVLAAPMVAPTRQEWQDLIATLPPREAEPIVDVVVPVYRGYDDTLRCLYSALAARCTTAHRIVVVNDASPDAALVEELRWLGQTGAIELHHNDTNLGFVLTCNRGMSLHPGRDVVLLNSDAEVYGDWLDRLRSAALREPRIATVTPLSNNAEICSYPFFVRNNDMALEVGYAEIDAITASVNAGGSLPLPTGVGFCMYIRRECLREIGPFDAERFGRGYGEENDFCLRAAAARFKNVLACDVFVRHTGGVSFGPEKEARCRAAMSLIHERFPGYGDSVSRFIRSDPARSARARIDLARLERRSTEAVLFVTHRWGGGIERHVQDLARLLEKRGVEVLFLRPHPARPHFVTLEHGAVRPTPNLGPFDPRCDLDALVATLRRLNVRHVHVHSLVGYRPIPTEWVQRMASELEVAYDFTVHDYASFCPRIHLVGSSGVYCGEPDAEACQRCIRDVGGAADDYVIVDEWREAYGRLLRGARAVFSPCVDAARRMQKHFPGLAVRVQPHVENPPVGPAIEPNRRNRKQLLRVAIVGALGVHKGYHMVRECARDALARGLPIEFRIVGYAQSTELTALKNVSMTGRYQDDALGDLLRSQQCDVAFFTSVWPETYSYTLSAAVAVGLYPVSFDFGAIAERIRNLRWGTVIPFTTDVRATNDRLLRIIPTPAPDVRARSALFARCEDVLADYYGVERFEATTPAEARPLLRASAGVE